MPDCQSCPYREEVIELKRKYSESRKDLYNRIEEIKNEQGRTDERYKALKEDISDLKAQQQKDFDELKNQQQQIIAKIDSLTQQPAKRWDTAITVFITALITTIVNNCINFLGGR